ncbi:hypothetical protein HD597_001661 [Nonomuraea thailandensis]|uniref:DUF4240 domain-containing protein n=1 Tax=Nonomuraea thailandensis TaxID=1188745 RepID=A0A9X2K2L9_9ACTN|nr:DUF4240 domain-containing protein [Nonomuraea thailandensis]MCP2354641.1 hypothetical protein [Nonomuraea thailandensis]
MDTTRYWQLVEDSRAGAGDEWEVAARLTDRLSALPPAEIIAAAQAFWDLMAGSYRAPLWGAAYMINGGCSDDAFEYFRGWLITQGREVFERVVADPDSLADLPAVQEAAAGRLEKDCEEMLGAAYSAYEKATGERLPQGSYTIRYPDLDPEWSFDFEEGDELDRRLPRLAALYDR